MYFPRESQMQFVYYLLLLPSQNLLFIYEVTATLPASEVKAYHWKLFSLLYCNLFILKIPTKWRKTSSRTNENYFFPFLDAQKCWFSQLCLHSGRVPDKMLRNQSILLNAGNDDNILLSFPAGSYRKQSGSSRIRKFNKIFETYFNIVFLDELK